MSYWDEAMREAYEEQMGYADGGVVNNPGVKILGTCGLKLPLRTLEIMRKTRANLRVTSLDWGRDYIDRCHKEA